MKTITNVSAGGIRPAEYAVVKISIRTKTVIEIRRTIRRKTCFFFLGKGKQTAENKHERRVCNRVVFGRHVRTTETAGNGGRWKKRFETRPTTTNGSAEWIRRVPSSFVLPVVFHYRFSSEIKKRSRQPDRTGIQFRPDRIRRTRIRPVFSDLVRPRGNAAKGDKPIASETLSGYIIFDGRGCVQ